MQLLDVEVNIVHLCSRLVYSHIPCMTLESSTANRIPSLVIWTWTLGAKLIQFSSWKSCLAELETALNTGSASPGSMTFDILKISPVSFKYVLEVDLK